MLLGPQHSPLFPLRLLLLPRLLQLNARCIGAPEYFHFTQTLSARRDACGRDAIRSIAMLSESFGEKSELLDFFDCSTEAFRASCCYAV